MKWLMTILMILMLYGCDKNFGILFSVPQIKQLSNHWESVTNDLFKKEFVASLEAIEVNYFDNTAVLYFSSDKVAIRIDLKDFSCYDSFSIPDKD